MSHHFANDIIQMVLHAGPMVKFVLLLLFLQPRDKQSIFAEQDI
jgi:hypothetical protein